MAYKRKDHYYLRAKRENKASRAAYKLTELQAKYSLIRKGNSVVDLGSAPGGWLQEISVIVGPEGKVVGIDLLPLKISLPKNSSFILGDITVDSDLQKVRELIGGTVDAIVSDMSPNLSGVYFADSYRSYEIAMRAFEVCEKLLKVNGNFLVKIFPGDEFDSFIKKLKENFKTVAAVVPDATRKTSSERYVIAKGFRKK